jgi:hypothetical protein
MVRSMWAERRGQPREGLMGSAARRKQPRRTCMDGAWPRERCDRENIPDTGAGYWVCNANGSGYGRRHNVWPSEPEARGALLALAEICAAGGRSARDTLLGRTLLGRKIKAGAEGGVKDETQRQGSRVPLPLTRIGGLFRFFEVVKPIDSFFLLLGYRVSIPLPIGPLLLSAVRSRSKFGLQSRPAIQCQTTQMSLPLYLCYVI